MRLLAVLLALAVAACNSPNEPPENPDMTGGWSGRRSVAWLTTFGPGGRTCDEIWIVSSQSSSGAFSGSITSTSGGGCSPSSSVSGTVDQFGNVILRRGIAQDCSLVSGETDFSGIVSGSALTARSLYTMRCRVASGLLDYQATETYTMNKR